MILSLLQTSMCIKTGQPLYQKSVVDSGVDAGLTL